MESKENLIRIDPSDFETMKRETPIFANIQDEDRRFWFWKNARTKSIEAIDRDRGDMYTLGKNHAWFRLHEPKTITLFTGPSILMDKGADVMIAAKSGRLITDKLEAGKIFTITATEVKE